MGCKILADMAENTSPEVCAKDTVIRTNVNQQVTRSLSQTTRRRQVKETEEQEVGQANKRDIFS
jgi:hypothetical protein